MSKQPKPATTAIQAANNAAEDPEVKKKLEESLEFCKDKLRDTHMAYQDLRQRCTIDFDNWKENQEEKVFYFQPDSFLFDRPEQQNAFRDQLINRICSMPKPEPIYNIADDLHRQYVQLLADQSTPKLAKRNLAAYFQRRQYQLQHLKYKLLCRWAHFSLTAEYMEKNSLYATQLYGKLEYNLEQAMSRYERLMHDDGFDEANPANRPHTKADDGEGNLFIENDLMKPQSLIREDDVEVYIRGVTYRNKVLKVMNKFLSRLKWIPLQNRFEIYEKALTADLELRNANIETQRQHLEQIELQMRKTYTFKKNVVCKKTSDFRDEEMQKIWPLAPEVEKELQGVKDSLHYSKFKHFYCDREEKCLNNWRADHDAVPDFVSNIYSLKLKITDTAKKTLEFEGNIELDHGYAYSYTISTIFPSYFQVQVIKSQFSLYDALSHNEDDKTVHQKNILFNNTKVDTNIFRDIYTVKNECPSDEALQLEIKKKNLKLLRLKSCGYWIDYVCLVPTQPDWDKKQEGILNNNNPIDNLFVNAMNLIDSNDLGTINKINEDLAMLHLTSVKHLYNKNPHSVVQETSHSTQDGLKKFALNQQSLINSNNEVFNISEHLLKVLKGEGFAITGKREDKQKTADVPQSRQLPAHLLTCFYSLRFIRCRDNKTKILYSLNFYRAVQKRLALDLREFGTRERCDSHFKEPMFFPKEGVKNIVTMGMANYTTDKAKNASYEQDLEFFGGQGTKKLKVFDEKALQGMNNMATLRQYKCNGVFNNLIMSTCPAFPKVHFTLGEPTTHQSEDLEMEQEKRNEGISERSIKMMGRIDRIELDEANQEVFVRDDFGIYVMYDCSLQDMKCLEDNLCRIASFYLMNSEVLQDAHDEKPMPAKDRIEVLDDLLQCESQFQFKKVKVIQVYMEAYEHISDPLEQQRLMQIVTDIMARRPRLNLTAGYFKDSYEAEFQLLDKEHELLKILLDTQVSLEKTENKNLQDSLCWSYTLANKFEDKKWQYSDAREFLKRFIKSKTREMESESYVKEQISKKIQKRRSTIATEKHRSTLQAIEEAVQEHQQDKKHKPDQIKETKDEQFDSSSEESDFDEFLDKLGPSNAFQTLLGLPEISLDTLYENYKEKDKDIIHYMNEHSNFINIHEGYPEFLMVIQGGNEGERKMRTFQVNPWSQECGNLDFYVSMDFVNRYYSITRQVQQELYDALKPHNASIMTHLDLAMIQTSIQEFRHVLEFFENKEIEYKGREYLEDESVFGNSEKVIFFAKEMLSNLTLTSKSALDPYQICKLDTQTIKFFDFSHLKVKKADGKYLMQRKKGTVASKWLVEATRKNMVEIAKKKKVKAIQNKLAQDLATGFVGALNKSTRKVEVPSQLQIYCNLMELIRLRNELILARSETHILQQVYQEQVRICAVTNAKIYFEEAVNFETSTEDEWQSYVDYVDEGPAYGLTIDLAICEFDPKLVSNLNFRHPDALKLCMTTSGLEEVRAALTYQLMQKQLLIVGTRINQLLIDHHCRALSQLRLFESPLRLTVPNPVVDFSKVFSKALDSVSQELITAERARFRSDMLNIGQNGFYNIGLRKVQRRTDWAKDYKTFLNKCQIDRQLNTQTVSRIMRCFKILIMTNYCQETLLKIHLDSQKIQALQACQGLRVIYRYLDFDINKLQNESKDKERKEDSAQIFKFDTQNFMLENIPHAYMPADLAGLTYASKIEETRVLDIDQMKIQDHFGIPSSLSLVNAEATKNKELEIFKQKMQSICKQKHGLVIDSLTQIDHKDMYCEDNLKSMLVTFTPRELDALQEQTTSEQQVQPAEDKNDETSQIRKHGCPLLDYDEALNFSSSSFAKLTRYYQHIERIFYLEWFIQQLHLKHLESVNMSLAFDAGLPFWNDTEYETRIKKSIRPTTKSDEHNQLAQTLLYNRIISKKKKKDIAEELMSLSTTIKKVIVKHRNKYATNSRENNYEYLQSYTEFRYMQIITSLNKLMIQFQQKANGQGTQAMKGFREAISRITKMDHVKVAYKSSNNYHVNTSLVHPEMQIIDSTNMLAGVYNHDDSLNFKRCIRPVINEKVMEPPQITLFQSLYQTDNFRRKLPSQFAGQFVSTHNSVPFKGFETALLDLTVEDRTYSQSYIVQIKFQANDYLESVLNDYSIKDMQNDDPYDLNQLGKAKGFLADTCQPLLLKNAIICWTENRVLPDDPKLYERYEENFRDKFFWKIIKQKERLVKNINSGFRDSFLPSNDKLRRLKNEIQKLQDDITLASKNQEADRAKMIKLLNEEFNEMKKKVIFDTIYTNKAEILVLKNEIEKFIINASIQTLENENAALAKCFTLAVEKIQMHIHPFQQFAATFYDEVDPNLHLDLVNKLSFVQKFLTQLRNRGTKVATLTSGPGFVFTLKDINECLLEFCRKLLKYSESELKSRSDMLVQREKHFMDLIFVKDQRIRTLEERAVVQQQNIQKLVSGKMFEKGHQLIYQLDTQSRLLALFKQHMFSLEREIRSQILGEMDHKINLQRNLVDKAKDKFDEYIDQTTSMLMRKLNQQEHLFKKYIETETRRITDLGTALIADKHNNADLFKLKTQDAARKTFYPSTTHPAAKHIHGITVANHASDPNSKQAEAQSPTRENEQQRINNAVAQEFVGTVVPAGFMHKTFCNCYEPSHEYPLPSIKMAGLEMMSEQEARFELAQNIVAIQKLRVFYKTKETIQKQQFQDEINKLKKQLNNNSYLWDQLAEAEKREKILKKELLFTQQSLASSENVIQKLQDEMKELEAERERLAKYKKQKAKRLKDLEDRVKKEEVYDNIDTEKLINVLGKKDEELKELQDVAKFASQRVEHAEIQKTKTINQYAKKFLIEQKRTQEFAEKMEQLKLELKMMESNDSAVVQIWKRKCQDLFEICTQLSKHNVHLRDRCQELIEQGLKLSDMVTQEAQKPGEMFDQGSQYRNLSVPKLAQNPIQPLKTNNSKPANMSSQDITSVGRGLTTAGTYALPLRDFDSMKQFYTSTSMQSMRQPHSVIQDQTGLMSDHTFNSSHISLPKHGIAADFRNPSFQMTVSHWSQERLADADNLRQASGGPLVPQTAYQNQRGKSNGTAGFTTIQPQTAGQSRSMKANASIAHHERKKLNILQVLVSDPQQVDQQMRLRAINKQSTWLGRQKEDNVYQNSNNTKGFYKSTNQDFELNKAASAESRQRIDSNLDFRKTASIMANQRQRSGLDKNGIIGSKIIVTQASRNNHDNSENSLMVQKKHGEGAILAKRRFMTQTEEPLPTNGIKRDIPAIMCFQSTVELADTSPIMTTEMRNLDLAAYFK